MNLSKNHKTYFINNFIKVFSLDKYFKTRLRISYFLYSICWCLILLNDFLNSRQENLSKNQILDSQLTNKQQRQLKKAKSLLKNTIAEYKNGFPYE